MLQHGSEFVFLEFDKVKECEVITKRMKESGIQVVLMKVGFLWDTKTNDKTCYSKIVLLDKFEQLQHAMIEVVQVLQTKVIQEIKDLGY